MPAVEVGFDVVGFDPDEGRVKRLAAGDSYVEDVTRRRPWPPRSPPAATSPPTTPSGCAGFDVAVIDVPTPLADGNPNLAHVEEAAGSWPATCGPEPP